MTRWLTGMEVGERIRGVLPGAVVAETPGWLEVRPDALLDVCRLLRDDPALAIDMATNVTSVDREEYFEVVYHLQSITENHILGLKTRPADYADPVVPSVEPIWKGAWLQEMEVYDLMGIRFAGHPNLRRLFLWEGFHGWPLRKEFMQVERGAFSPGLPFFPKQGGSVGVLNGPNWTNPRKNEEAGPEVPDEWTGATEAALNP